MSRKRKERHPQSELASVYYSDIFFRAAEHVLYSGTKKKGWHITSEYICKNLLSQSRDLVISVVRDFDLNMAVM